MTVPPFNSIIVFSILTGYVLKTAVPQFACTQNWFCASMMVFWSISIPWLFCSAYLYPFHLSPLRHLPTVKGGNWLMGHLWTEVSTPIGHPHKDWTYSIPNEGLIRYLSIFNSERLIITSAKGLSEVLVTNCYDYQKPPLAGRSLRRIIGDGLVLAEGDVHKVQRKNMMPAFAFRHVKELYPIFWAKSRQGTLAMTEEVLSNLGKPHLGEKKAENVPPTSPLFSIGNDQAVLDSSAWSSRITLDIIGIASAGIDFGAIHDPTGKLFTTYQQLFKVSLLGKISDILSVILPPWLSGIIPSQRRREIAEASELIKSTARDLLRTKKQKLEKEKGSVGNDILSIALESGAFSEENLIDQMMTFLAAGHETTGSAMTWATYMLCLYPAMQTRLREEIRANLPSLNTETPVTSFDIDHLPFLNAFCNELLRYWPPVALTYREASVDTTLLGRHIPKGTTFLIAPIATNRNSELWGPDPSKFDPERWLVSGSGGATSNFSMTTFLHGPRSCIGQSFSKAEFACLLATWVGRFEFEFNDLEQKDESQILVKGGGSMRPRGGMFVRTRIVDGW